MIFVALLLIALPSVAAQTGSVCSNHLDCKKANHCPAAQPEIYCDGRACQCREPAVAVAPGGAQLISFAASAPASLHKIKFTLFTKMKLTDDQATGNTVLLPNGNTQIIDHAKTTGAVKNTAQLISDLLNEQIIAVNSAKTQAASYQLTNFKITAVKEIKKLESENSVFGTMIEREMQLHLEVTLETPGTAATATVTEMKKAIKKLKDQKWDYEATAGHLFSAPINSVSFGGMGDTLKFINFMESTAYFEEVLKAFAKAQDVFTYYKDYANAANLYGFEARMNKIKDTIASLEQTTKDYLTRRGASVTAPTTYTTQEFCAEVLSYRLDTRKPGDTTSPVTAIDKPKDYQGQVTTTDYHMCICAQAISAQAVVDADGPDNNIRTGRCRRNANQIESTTPTVDFGPDFLRKGIAMSYDADIMLRYIDMRVDHLREIASNIDNRDYATGIFAQKTLQPILKDMAAGSKRDYTRLYEAQRNTEGPSQSSQVGYHMAERELNEFYTKAFNLTISWGDFTVNFNI